MQQSWDGERLVPLVSILGTVPPGPALNGREASVSLGRDGDGERAASALRWLRSTSGLELVHLGDWHAHPAGYCELSSGDLKTARKLQAASESPVWIAAVAVSSCEPWEKVDASSRLIHFQHDLYVTAELRFYQVQARTFEPLPVTFSDSLPLLPPLPWHINDPARFAGECRLLAAAGFKTEIDAPRDGRAGLMLRLRREGGRAIVVYTAPNYPRKAPELSDERGRRLALRGEWSPNLFLVDVVKELETMKKLDAHARWQRIEGIVDVPGLAKKRVLVVGVGSGGSTVAVELAKAGVGHFTLIDYDHVEQVNVIRHECDEDYLGRLKVGAIAELIHKRNPDAEVEAIAKDVCELGPRLEELVAEADLVVVCTDVEPPKRLLNRLALATGTAAVYAGVYARGTGGEVIRCGGGPEDPCYACVFSVLKEAAPVPVDPAEKPNYGAVEADGSAPSAPGLGLDVRMIALLQAKVCLLSLLGREQELGGNVLLFGTAALEGLFPRPFASALLTVAPQSDCRICGSGSPLRAAART